MRVVVLLLFVFAFGILKADVDLSAARDCIVSVPSDVSYVGQNISVDPTASITNYPATAYPAGKDFLLWRNVNLTDVKSFAAKLGGRMYGTYDARKWVEASVYYVETNANGSVECQFQTSQNDYIYSVRVVFTQKGNDVYGRIGFGSEDRIRYTYKTAEKKLGFDFRTVSTGKTTLGSSYMTCGDAEICIKDISCVLNGGISVKTAPERIVFENTDATLFGESVLATNVYADVVYPRERKFIAFKGVSLDDAVGLFGEMGGSKMGNAWRKADGYHLKRTRDSYANGAIQTNAGSRVNIQIQASGSGSGLYCCKVALRQYGADILAEVYNSQWAYGKKLGEFDFDSAGSAVSFVDTVDGAGISLRNLHLVTKRQTVRSITIRTYADCLKKGWVKVWPGVRLDDVSPARASMGGASVGSGWRPVLAWLPTYHSGSGCTNWYFQTPWSSSTRSIRVAFAQEGDDVWACVRKVTYGYQKGLPWAAGDGDYLSALTNTVDGSVEGKSTLAICDVACSRLSRPVHTVTVDEGFKPGAAPIHLRDVELRFAPSDGKTYTLDVPVSGYGSIAVAGNFILACKPVGEVTVKLVTGGRLQCNLSAGSVPLLNGGAPMSLEGGEVSFISSEPVKDWLEVERAYPLTSNACITEADAEKVSATLSGGGLGSYKVAFSVVGGELCATFTKRHGLSVLLQ